METFFAPAERTTDDQLAEEIQIISNNPMISGLLQSAGGMLAVLDERRQLVALNDSLLKLLGVDDPAQAFGLRLGEALNCIYAAEEPAGCGTTKWCSSCGAAIAIVASLSDNQPAERICALSSRRGARQEDLALRVKAQPFSLTGSRYLLIFIQDITREQQRAALERIFFHDVNNLLCMLVGASELLVTRDPSELALTINRGAHRLHKEIAIQRCLSEDEAHSYRPLNEEISPTEMLAELQAQFVNHPAAGNRKLCFQNGPSEVTIYTDRYLISRIVSNMIINALEASHEQDPVSVWAERKEGQVVFSVWNGQQIPESVVGRIFQRNSSTKEQPGRGVGTYSMKFLGEDVLGGSVWFTTSALDGTTFRFALPEGEGSCSRS
ncbi:sensor histidine kinase [Desulfofustis glycolicus]|uniref:histidine kinase n=1 Tax=Desulfofustis glycolicus DSM 9705 TaxID=1121409 RepID=A0A1M5UTX8_9BACT|nr:sensor histidine kinase [Desulfofustis glycolicus]MCB2215853.1 sensor histidine kinase [Desulfobulbaceae bacterium]SHH66507.1 Histidine kinase-, DNA gyrase B-, and HSP90-like ATPase [Desulfofustis glycolicus DSM 9705]